MNKMLFSTVSAALLHLMMPSTCKSQDIFIDIAKELAKQAGTSVWNKMKGEPTSQDLHEKTTAEIKQHVTEEINKNRISRAITEYETAKREVLYYNTNPGERIGSLAIARVASEKSMADLQQLELLGFKGWLLSAELHLAILQEEGKTKQNKEEEKKIVKEHVKYINDHYKKMNDKVTGELKYSMVQDFKKKNGQYMQPLAIDEDSEPGYVSPNNAAGLPNGKAPDTAIDGLKKCYVVCRKLKELEK